MLSDDWLISTQKLSGNRVSLHLTVDRPADESCTDFHKEMDKSVCHVMNTFHKPKFLALSGGMDSEYVANALLRNKILFTPILLKINNYNSSELWYAEHWCKTNNIKPIVLTADPKKILDYIKTKVSKEFLTRNIGGFVNVFLADYVQSKYDGVLLTGSGDPTINPAGIYIDNKPSDIFYYWDVDVVLDLIRPKQHPRGMISYFPETLYSYIHNYDTSLTEQEAKAKLYNIPIRPKIDVFDMVPEWTEYMVDMQKYVMFENYYMGTKEQALKWLTKKETK